MGDLVSLFRCRQCRVSMFEQDCAGHLQRHGVAVRELSRAQILARFERGPQTAAARPGANVKPMYPQAKRKHARAGGESGDGVVEIEDDLN